MLSIFFLLLSILLTVLNPVGHQAGRMPSPTRDIPAAKARVVKSYGALPMSFEMNQGQAERAVQFLARGQGYAIFLKPSEAVLALRSPEQGPRFPDKAQSQPRSSTRVLRMRIEGANLSAPARSLHRLPGITNYFIGNDPRRWHTNIPTYEKVEFENIRPGVNLVYYGNQGQLEYDLVLSAGVKPTSLKLSYEGSEASINEQGDLVFTSTGGKVSFRRPVAYQCNKQEPARKHYLTASYVLKGHNRVGFEVPNYDPRQPLTIDPVLYFSTYLGGIGGDAGNAIALDYLSDAFVTGSTASSNFPTVNAYQKNYAGDTDAFVTMLRSDGQVAIYSTFLGGNNYDAGSGIGVDSSGDAYIVGTTSSANFPTTSGVYQPTLAGTSNAFVAKLDPTGSHLLYSTFLGGSYIDYGLGMALDLYGNVYVTGSTQSSDFPTLNPIQSGNAGNGDAFVAEIDTTAVQQQQLVYSTYLGGSSADVGTGITVDPGGNAYVVGYTFSTNFPTYNPFQAANGGSVDAFIAKLSTGGLSLVFSTYLGGQGDDRGWAIALDGQRNIYVTGSTLTSCTPATTTTTMCNPASTFPTTPGAFQTSVTSQAPGYAHVFVTKFNFIGTTSIYSTLLGGALTDSPGGIAVDSSGDAYITGYTQSNNFPTANAVQAGYTGGTCGSNPCPDVFVTEVNPTGASLVYSTYLGGSAANFGNGITVNASNEAFVVGTTTSMDFPAIAGDAYPEPGNSNGDGNAFVAMISPTDAAGVAITPQKLNFGPVNLNTATNLTSAGFPATVTLLNAGTVPLLVSSIATSGDFSESGNCVGTVPAGGGRCTINVTFTPTELVTETQVLYIYDNATGSPHVVTLTGTGINETTTVEFSPINLVFGAETVGVSSPPQTVTMINNGQTPLKITNITTTGDFAETNNCPPSPTTLAVNQSCQFQVTFTPTTSGTRPGSLTVTDNVSSGSSSVALSGTGNPLFTLTTPTLVQVLPIGTTTTYFTISLSSLVSNFTDTISLSCTGGASCSFSSTTIALGQPTVPTTSTMTLSGLSPTTLNPFIFSVSGLDTTTKLGTATLNLTIYFSDFSLSASPAINSVASGLSTIYTITVAPINAFNQPVILSCLTSSLPQGSSCIFSPAAVTPNIGAGTSQLTVSTTAQSTTTTWLIPKAFPRIPPGPTIMLVLWGASLLMMLIALLARRKMGRRGSGGRKRYAYAWVAFAALLLATALWIGCEPYIYTNVLQPSTVNGTPTGNYKITINGAFTGSTAIINGTTTTVTHTTTVNLTVD
jgi:hypothetical protein